MQRSKPWMGWILPLVMGMGLLVVLSCQSDENKEDGETLGDACSTSGALGCNHTENAVVVCNEAGIWEVFESCSPLEVCKESECVWEDGITMDGDVSDDDDDSIDDDDDATDDDDDDDDDVTDDDDDDDDVTDGDTDDDDDDDTDGDSDDDDDDDIDGDIDGDTDGDEDGDIDGDEDGDLDGDVDGDDETTACEDYSGCYIIREATMVSSATYSYVTGSAALSDDTCRLSLSCSEESTSWDWIIVEDGAALENADGSVRLNLVTQGSWAWEGTNADSAQVHVEWQSSEACAQACSLETVY